MGFYVKALLFVEHQKCVDDLIPLKDNADRAEGPETELCSGKRYATVPESNEVRPGVGHKEVIYEHCMARKSITFTKQLYI